MLQTSRRTTWAGPALGLLLFSLALLVRLYKIDLQSLWADEGSSVALAQRSLAQIARDSARDTHPPLYAWLLHLWIGLAGSSAIALRGLSALCGAGTLLLTWLLGRRLFGAPAAWLGTAAALCSPFAVHYAQETRMYALVTLLGALSWLLLLGWLERGGRWRLGGWWLAALAIVLTHYVGAAILLAQNLVCLYTLLRPRALPLAQASATPTGAPCGASEPSPAEGGPRAGRPVRAAGAPLRWWLAAQLALLLAFLPWLLYAREQLEQQFSPGQPLGPLAILADLLRVSALGPHAQPGWSWAAAFWLALLLCGLLARPRRGSRPDGRLLCAAWIGLPLALVLLLSLEEPFYRARFLLMALPAAHLLVGHGAVALTALLRLPRAGAALAALLLLGFSFARLQLEWRDPALWRDDYRSLAAEVAASAGPADAIMLLGGGQVEVFDYYYAGPLPRYPLPRFRPLDPSVTIAELETIAAGHRRLYGVFWGEPGADPQGLIEGWLASHAFKGGERWFGRVRLALYEFAEPGGALLSAPARFGPALLLEQVAAEPLAASPGDMLRVALSWRASRPIERPLLLFLHLLDEHGQIVSQYDGLPALRASPDWPPDTPQRGRIGLLIPRMAGPGTYRLALGLYDAQSGERLKLPDGNDYLVLAQLALSQHIK